MAGHSTETVPGPGAETAARILDAAGRLFGAHGYDAVSIQNIAAAAQVSKANVFHHFGSKENLYFAVLQAACSSAAQRLDDLERKDQPIATRLARFAADHYEDLVGHEAVTRLILRELLADGPRQGPALASQVFGDKFARFVAILRTAQARGELRPDLDPAMVVSALIGANVFFFQAREVLRHFPDVGFADDPKRFAELLADILLLGIARPPSKTP